MKTYSAQMADLLVVQEATETDAQGSKEATSAPKEQADCSVR